MSKGREAATTIDVRQQPAYGLAEAALYLRLPPATLRSWALGRPFPKQHGEGRFEQLLKPASKAPPMLSFWNLVEAHVLRSLRTQHAIPVKSLRKALTYAEKELGIERLLLHRDLRAAAGRVFLQRYGELIELSASGQLAMQKIFEEHLRRVVWDESLFPVRLYPFVSSQVPGDRPIAIDPRIAFGRPVMERAGVSTRAIADRIDAGEDADSVADDYGLSRAEIEQAVVYERAA